jgi:hypothetical protein
LKRRWKGENGGKGRRKKLNGWKRASEEDRRWSRRECLGR